MVREYCIWESATFITLVPHLNKYEIMSSSYNLLASWEKAFFVGILMRSKMCCNGIRLSVMSSTILQLS